MEPQDIERIESLYQAIAKLPVAHPEEFNLFSSGFKRTDGEYNNIYSTSFFATSEKFSRGYKGRINLWKDYIIPEWAKSSLAEIAEKEGLSFKISDHFFKSRLSVRGNKDIRLDIWSPKGSTLLSFLFGNEVKAKFRKN